MTTGGEFDRALWGRERQATLEQRVDFLEGEVERLLRLLGFALEIIGARTDLTWPETLSLLVAMTGDNPGKAAIHDNGPEIQREPLTLDEIGRSLETLRATA